MYAAAVDTCIPSTTTAVAHAPKTVCLRWRYIPDVTPSLLNMFSRPPKPGAEVVKRCTGEATFAAIVDDLAKTFSAPRERVLADVTALLRGLADKRLLEL